MSKVMEAVLRSYHEQLANARAQQEAAAQTAEECAEASQVREMANLQEVFHQQELAGSRIATDKELSYEYDQEQ